MKDLWNQVRQYFEIDDGGLPGVGMEGFTRKEVVDVYSYLRSLGGTPNEDAAFWHREERRDVPLDSVPSAAELIASEEADPCHFVLSGIVIDHITLPEIGVFVSPESIMLDYRAGLGWSAGVVTAFFQMLRSMLARAPKARLAFDSAFGDPHGFLRAWSFYLQSYPLEERPSGAIA